MSKKVEIYLFSFLLLVFGVFATYALWISVPDSEGKHFIQLDESIDYVITGESEIDYSIWNDKFPTSKKQDVYSGGFDGLFTIVSKNSKVVIYNDDSPHEPSIPQLSGMIDSLLEGVDGGEFHYISSVTLSGVDIEGTGFEDAQAYLFVDKDSFKDGQYNLYLVSEDREFSKLTITEEVLPLETLELYIG